MISLICINQLGGEINIIPKKFRKNTKMENFFGIQFSFYSFLSDSDIKYLFDILTVCLLEKWLKKYEEILSLRVLWDDWRPKYKYSSQHNYIIFNPSILITKLLLKYQKMYLLNRILKETKNQKFAIFLSAKKWLLKKKKLHLKKELN